MHSSLLLRSLLSFLLLCEEAINLCGLDSRGRRVFAHGIGQGAASLASSAAGHNSDRRPHAALRGHPRFRAPSRDSSSSWPATTLDAVAHHRWRVRRSYWSAIPAPERGQFSSLADRSCAKFFDRGCDAAMITPVDCPPLSAVSLERLCACFLRRARAGFWAVAPENDGKHGHPLFVTAR